jgi:hypothetical protein
VAKRGLRVRRAITVADDRGFESTRPPSLASMSAGIVGFSVRDMPYPQTCPPIGLWIGVDGHARHGTNRATSPHPDLPRNPRARGNSPLRPTPRQIAAPEGPGPDAAAGSRGPARVPGPIWVRTRDRGRGFPPPGALGPIGRAGGPRQTLIRPLYSSVKGLGEIHPCAPLGAFGPGGLRPCGATELRQVQRPRKLA